MWLCQSSIASSIDDIVYASSLLFHGSGGSVCLSVVEPTIVQVLVVQLFNIIHCDNGGLMICRSIWHTEDKVIHVYTVQLVYSYSIGC